MLRFVLSVVYAFTLTYVAIERLGIEPTSLAIVTIAILIGQIIFKKI